MIWIRHGFKAYNSSPDLDYDPPLIPGQETYFKRLASVLILRFGRPEVIITSPCLRARQTASLLNVTLNVPLEVCLDLSEKVDAHATFKPETLAFGHPPVGETEHEFQARLCRIPMNPKAWYVSHSGVIKRIANVKTIKEGEYVKIQHDNQT